MNNERKNKNINIDYERILNNRKYKDILYKNIAESEKCPKDKPYIICGDKKIDASKNKGNLKGTLRTLDFTAGAVPLQNGIFAKNGVVMLDDSSSYIIDEEGNVKKRENAEKDIYIFNFGTDYFGGIKEFYSLTGYTPLLPKYVLANWWSRYYAYRQDEYIELMDKFTEKEVPLTVATIDMDWHLVKDVPKDKKTKAKGIYSTGWTGYTWNKKLFPDYKKFFNDLKERGLAITLNLHPCDGVRYFEDQYIDMAKACGVDTSSKDRVVFNLEDEKFRNAYFDILHHPIIL